MFLGVDGVSLTSALARCGCISFYAIYMALRGGLLVL